jgi:hypothetical protein
MVEKLGEITEREFCGYWDQTIADAGDTEATLQAMAAKILRYRQLGDVSFHLPMNIAVPVVDSLGP